MKIYLGSKPRSGSKKYVNQAFTKPIEANLGDPASFLPLNHFDYTCISFKDGWRSEKNFLEANCLYLDFDHFLRNPDPEALLKVQNQILSPLNTPCFAIPSHSQLGFHAFFPIGSNIKDVNEYKSIYKALIEKLGGRADQQVKDGARFGFGTGIDDNLFLRQVQAINSDKSINLPFEIPAEATFPSYPNNYTPSTFDTHTEGFRNENCHKLACSLLNRYSVDIAHSIYLSQCEGNGLSDRELESCFQSAVKSMIDSGMAYTSAKNRASHSEAVEIIQTPSSHMAQGVEEKYKEEYLKDYSLYGQNTASKILIEKTKLNGESVSLQNHLIHLASTRWARNEFYPVFQRMLEEEGWTLTGKDVNSIIQTVSAKNASSSDAVTYIPQLAGWFAYNPENGKWEASTEGEAVIILKDGLRALYDGVCSLNQSDQIFEASLQKTLSLPNLNHLFKLYSSTSYKEFEDKAGSYTIPCPNWLYRFDEKGNLTKEKITPSSHILNEFSCNPSFEKSKVWEDFLRSVIPDADDRLWVQMVLGSQILGIPSPDQSLYFWVGDGANGKSTLFDEMIRLFHDFQKVVNPETFSNALNSKEAEYARAEFMGKRMVIANEVSDKFTLDPSQIKVLCSKEAVEASKKFVNKFNYDPTHTANMILNSLPNIANVDDKGLYRRIRVFKFTQSFEGAKADKNLGEKLAKEDARILGWLFEGAKLFIQNGLKPCENKNVEKWTADYIRENDSFSTFMDDLTVPNRATCIKISDLRALYYEWQKMNPTSKVLSSREFGIKLQKKGFIKTSKTVEGSTFRVIDNRGFNRASTIWHMLESGKYRNGMPFEEYPAVCQEGYDF